jgi:hypothetical protein
VEIEAQEVTRDVACHVLKEATGVDEKGVFSPLNSENELDEDTSWWR